MLKFTPKISIFTNITGLIIGLITLWSSITTYIENITISQTKIIATIIATDLRTRLNLYESYSSELKSNNENVPILLIYNIKSLKDQLNDLKEWDNEN